MTSRVALVTGGTGGIGTAICKRLAKAGHRVATNYRTEEKARAWEQAMRAEGFEFTLVPGDVSSPEDAEAMVRRVEEALGPVEVLVNNAGITRDSTFHKMTPQQWTDVITTNLNACYNVTRPVIEGMRERKWGRIVQISSINGQKGQYGQANYAAAKADMHGFTISLAQENAKLGITVNTVSPGYIGTDMVMAIREDIRQSIIDSVPMKRLGKPEEIGGLCAYLASDLAGYITGATININGGLHMC